MKCNPVGDVSLPTTDQLVMSTGLTTQLISDHCVSVTVMSAENTIQRIGGLNTAMLTPTKYSLTISHTELFLWTILNNQLRKRCVCHRWSLFDVFLIDVIAGSMRRLNTTTRGAASRIGATPAPNTSATATYLWRTNYSSHRWKKKWPVSNRVGLACSKRFHPWYQCIHPYGQSSVA